MAWRHVLYAWHCGQCRDQDECWCAVVVDKSLCDIQAMPGASDDASADDTTSDICYPPYFPTLNGSSAAPLCKRESQAALPRDFVWHEFKRPAFFWLRRPSAFPPTLAAAHMRVWAYDIATSATRAAPPRACEIAPCHPDHRNMMANRDDTLVAHFATTVSLSELAAPDRPRTLAAVPIAVYDGRPAALVPTPTASFAGPLASDAAPPTQMRPFSTYLPCKPLQLLITSNTHADIVFALPFWFEVPSRCCGAPTSPLSQSPRPAIPLPSRRSPATARSPRPDRRLWTDQQKSLFARPILRACRRIL